MIVPKLFRPLLELRVKENSLQRESSIDHFKETDEFQSGLVALYPILRKTNNNTIFLYYRDEVLSLCTNVCSFVDDSLMRTEPGYSEAKKE